MPKNDIIILTESRYLNPQTRNDYINNVLLEDKLIHDALNAKLLRCSREDWASKSFNWSNTKFVLFRSTWDYFHRFSEFSDWLDKISNKTTLINTKELIHWNVDKHYLRDLKEKGIRVVKTVFVEKEDKRSLSQIFAEHKWDDFILKPAVSGAARHTYRINKKNIKDHENIFKKLIAKESMLLQAFQNNIMTKGEISLMLFGGKYSHSVLKKAKPGDFRVQDDFGGSVESYDANEEEIYLAEKAFAACQTMPVYGRADIIRDNDNELAIAELELIEPELWLRKDKGSAERFANAIFEHIKNSNLNAHKECLDLN